MSAVGYFSLACRVAFVGGVAAVTVTSLLPAATLPVVTGWDKFLHFAAYGGLALIGGFGFTGARAKWAILAGLIALGGFLEVGQQFIGRVASMADGVANGLGALAGIAIHYVRAQARRRRGRPKSRT